MSLSLRSYQERGIGDVLALFARGVRRVLLVLPTGGGKTVVASEIVRRVLELYAGRALFLAHRRELVKQAFAKLIRNGLPAGDLGVIMAGIPYGAAPMFDVPEDLDDEELWTRWARRRPSARIGVGSIDTFRNKVRPELGRGLVVVDEAHRALAKSYVDVQASYPETFHLGLTATPFRAGGKGLRDAYDEMVVVSSYAELVAEGFLVAPRCFGAPRDVDLSSVRTSKGEYNTDDLASVVDKAEIVGDIVDNWKRLGNDAPTFVFAVNVAHSKHLADRFNAAGVPAVHVDGSMPTHERDAAFRALRDGSKRVLCNCDVATEGTDVPCVKTIVLARPTLSERVYLQQVGRGARPFEGRPFIVLDHAGCVPTFGRPQMPREYSLDGRRKKPTAGLAPEKKCPACFAYNPISARVCEDCGVEFEISPEKELKEKPGELVELTGAQLGRLEQWHALVSEWRWANLERIARGEKLLEGKWCRGEWKRRTGDWATKGCKLPKLTAEEIAYNAELVETARGAAAARATASARNRSEYAHRIQRERHERQVERMGLH